MKIIVKKGEEIIINRDDAVKVTDKVGAYELIYEDGTGQIVFKDSGIGVIIETKF